MNVEQLDLLSYRPKGPFITEPDTKRLGKQHKNLGNGLWTYRIVVND